MLNSRELGQAIDRAIALKIASGAIKSKADVAKHFGIKTPSVYDWIKKGSISKEKLPELWDYFSDVVGYEHWGLVDNPRISLTGTPGGASNSTQPLADTMPPEVKELAERMADAFKDGRMTPDSMDLMRRMLDQITGEKTRPWHEERKRTGT